MIRHQICQTSSTWHDADKRMSCMGINDHHHISAACQTQGLASCAVNVYLPKDRVTSQHQGYGFVEFKSEEDADYVSPETHLSYSQHHASALS